MSFALEFVVGFGLAATGWLIAGMYCALREWDNKDNPSA